MFRVQSLRNGAREVIRAVEHGAWATFNDSQPRM